MPGMLTRSRARETNQPVFVDEKWMDAYILTKDEQIDAMMAADATQQSWDDLQEEGSDADDSDADADASGSDVWHSDSQDSELDSDDEDEHDTPHATALGDSDVLLQPRPAQIKQSVVGRWLASGGLMENVFWTGATLLLMPLLLYASLPRGEGHRWPLQSASLFAFLLKVALNLLTLAVLALALYVTSCSTESLSLSDALQWKQLELEPPRECSARLLAEGKAWLSTLLAAVKADVQSDAPLRRLEDDLWALLAALYEPVARQLAGLALGAMLALSTFHRAWAKALVLLTATGFAAFNVASEVQSQRRAAVAIFSLDPTFAFVNESIFVAIDGQNLEQGGSVAWAPYWGGLQQQQASGCPKRFPQPLGNGGVLVTFDQVNEYVPCYMSARAAASAVVVKGEIRPTEALQCFEDIRLRVKDQKSVPGWSLHQHSQQEDEAVKQEL